MPGTVNVAGILADQDQRGSVSILRERVADGQYDYAMKETAHARYRGGGKNAWICFAFSECSLGAILVAGSEKGICAIFIGDGGDALLQDLARRFPRARLVRGDAEFEALAAKVAAFVEEPGLGLYLPLDLHGTVFQQRVWRALREIPAGSTASYADIAKRIGTPKSARAVARACGANPIAVAIPCHRVIGSDGALSGYRWGVARKRALLEREARLLAGFKKP